MHKLRIGDRIRHRRRDQYGTYGGVTSDPTVAWVTFDGELDPVKVSRDQLAKVTK